MERKIKKYVRCANEIGRISQKIFIETCSLTLAKLKIFQRERFIEIYSLSLMKLEEILKKRFISRGEAEHTSSRRYVGTYFVRVANIFHLRSKYISHPKGVYISPEGRTSLVLTSHVQASGTSGRPSSLHMYLC